MTGSLINRRQMLQRAVAATLPLGLISCAAKPQQQRLIVGGLPVTCNLTLPVACVARAASNAANSAAGPHFGYEFSKYSG